MFICKSGLRENLPYMMAPSEIKKCRIQTRAVDNMLNIKSDENVVCDTGVTRKTAKA